MESSILYLAFLRLIKSNFILLGAPSFPHTLKSNPPANPVILPPNNIKITTISLHLHQPHPNSVSFHSVLYYNSLINGLLASTFANLYSPL